MSGFVPNPAFEEELAAACVPRLVAAAETIKARAEAEKHSIMPRKGNRPVVIEASATEVRVRNTDHGSWIDEIGSINSPPYAPLRRAARAAGLRLVEHGQ